MPLERKLNFNEAAALVVGSVIGTGVFLKAAIMSQTTGAPIWVLSAWAVAGMLSLIGALCYAELGGLFPRAGGEYVYLREAYGGLPSFLYGWMRFWIGSPGSIAAYAVGTATFMSGMFDLGGSVGKNLVALGLIFTFTGINCASVVVGGRVQTLITALKIVMIASLSFSLFAFAANASWANLTPTTGGEFKGFSAFGTAMLAALWAYDGWNNMPMAAGEIRDPGRNIPRALSLGMLVVLVLYLLVNLAYFYALPFAEVLSAYSKNNPQALPVATKAAESAFGGVAVGVLSFAFVISALGAMNGSILTGARVPFAMARDGMFFRRLGEVSNSGHTPVYSVLIQGAISCALALSGTFDQLTDYVVFASWIFYALVTGSLFVFRARLPGTDRPFRVPGYPVLPAVFLVSSVLLLGNTLVTSPTESCIGLGFIAAGVPVYLLFARKRRDTFT